MKGDTNKLSWLQYLLVRMAGEAGETAQAAEKCLTFGMLSHNPLLIDSSTNWVALKREVHDIIAVYDLICNEFDRVEILERELIERKKHRIRIYAGSSHHAGLLEENKLLGYKTKDCDESK